MAWAGRDVVNGVAACVNYILYNYVSSNILVRYELINIIMSCSRSAI